LGAYRKIAVRYVLMAEELRKGPARDEDAIERADRMTSRLQPDATIEGLGFIGDVAASGAGAATADCPGTQWQPKSLINAVEAQARRGDEAIMRETVRAWVLGREPTHHREWSPRNGPEQFQRRRHRVS
jgi:hypothetical protein